MTREDYCTHPNQKWCDCDWCRYITAKTCRLCGFVGEGHIHSQAPEINAEFIAKYPCN